MLKEQGILSESEFAEQKALILSSTLVQGQPVSPPAVHTQPPLVTLADPAEQLRLKQEHELKLEKMKLEAKQEETRRQEQLAAERMNNQLMLAQTAQTANAARQAPAAPIIVNNNNNNNSAPVQQVMVVKHEAAPKVPVNHCQHCMCFTLTVGAWTPCWIYACCGCGCEKPCGC